MTLQTRSRRLNLSDSNEVIIGLVLGVSSFIIGILTNDLTIIHETILIEILGIGIVIHGFWRKWK